jgi:hypothetical protein
MIGATPVGELPIGCVGAVGVPELVPLPEAAADRGWPVAALTGEDEAGLLDPLDAGVLAGVDAGVELGVLPGSGRPSAPTGT